MFVPVERGDDFETVLLDILVTVLVLEVFPNIHDEMRSGDDVFLWFDLLKRVDSNGLISLFIGDIAESCHLFQGIVFAIHDPFRTRTIWGVEGGSAR